MFKKTVVASQNYTHPNPKIGHVYIGRVMQLDRKTAKTLIKNGLAQSVKAGVK